MTVKAVWHIAKESAKSIGAAKLAPQDLRTFRYKLPNGALAAGNEFDQPSTIALASSRTLDVAAPVVEG